MSEGKRRQRLFVTGGTGFFGKSMLDYRLRHPGRKWAGAEWVVLSRSPERFMAAFPALAGQGGVSFVSGDVRDFPFPEGPFDAVVHAAAPIGDAVPDEEIASVMIEGTRRVLDFAEAKGGGAVLFTSSGAVYGPRTSPAKEDDALKPATAYGMGKQAAEKMLVESGLDVKIARCFAFVGPYLDRRANYAIGNFIQDCLDGRPVVVNGDGSPLRSYLFADDLVEWLFAILERGGTGRPYNVGSDQAVSILALAERVRAVLGSSNAIEVRGRPPVAPSSAYLPDISRAKDELGLEVKTSLDEAIRRSIPTS